MKVIIRYQGNIEELKNRWPGISNICYDGTYGKQEYQWTRDGVTSYDAQCMVIGKTGYGKSTFVNSLVGADIFETSAIRSTTRAMQCADYQVDGYRNLYFSIVDLPGIGESDTMDHKYITMYERMICKSQCIVYLLRADTRDHSIDLSLFKKFNHMRSSIVIGLNFVDQIEPISRTFPFIPSSAQLGTIARKVSEVSRDFAVPSSRIIPFSSTEKWGMVQLIDAISARFK